jgi:hypothetical protein
MSQEGIEPFTIMVASQGINHPTIASCDNKLCHTKIYKHEFILDQIGW